MTKEEVADAVAYAAKAWANVANAKAANAADVAITYTEYAEAWAAKVMADAEAEAAAVAEAADVKI